MLKIKPVILSVGFVTFIALIVLTFLVSPVLLRAADTSIPRVGANFGTFYGFSTPGDSFTNQQVKGNRLWTSQFINDAISPGLAVDGVTLELNTFKDFDVVDGFLGKGNLQHTADVFGPPLYRWLFGAIDPYYAARGIVGFAGDQIDFTPGFDASRVFDSTVFTESGVQTLTVTVIPHQEIERLQINLNIIEDSYLNATVEPLKTDISQRLVVSPDSHNVTKLFLNPPIGVPITYQFKINVLLKPDTRQVDFLPIVSVNTNRVIQNGQGVLSPSLSHEIPGYGTWTWTTSLGDCLWNWEEWEGLVLNFPSHSKGILNPQNPSSVPPSEADDNDFVSSVPLPDQISTDPPVIGTNLLLASVLVILFYFAVTLFNSTFKENYPTIRGWFARFFIQSGSSKSAFKNLLTRKIGIPSWLELILIIIITAVINSLVDPTFGFNQKSLSIFVAMIATVLVSTYSYNGIRLLIMKYRLHIPVSIKAYPLAILLAVLFVLISRVVAFRPGFIFGFVGALTLLSPALAPGKKHRSIVILCGSFFVILIALSAFFLRSPLSSLADGYWKSLLDIILVALFVGGIERVLFGLIPLTFLDGGTLASWKKLVWLFTFGGVVFLFIHIVVNKTDTLTRAVTNMNVITLFILVIISLIISLAFWIFFFFRSKKLRAV
jgi:hypothetical protein